MRQAVEVLPPERKPVGRPVAALSMVPSRDIRGRIATINDYHQSACAAMRDAAAYAVMAGLELIAAKSTLPHGSWDSWVNTNCEFNIRTAQRYMGLAERLTAVGALKRALAGCPGGQVQTKGDRAAVLAAVGELTNGHELQQLYFDYGILREAKPTGGTREGAGRPSKAEQTQREARMAYEDWKAISGPLARYVSSKRFLYLDAQQLNEMREILRGALDLIKDGVGK